MQRTFWVGVLTWLALVGAADAGGLKPLDGGAPPELRLADLEGRRHSLAEYEGQVVLVNFWASWCPPCVEEMPSMQGLNARLAGRPLAIVGVNMGEDPTAIRDFLDARQDLDFDILLDRDGDAVKAWNVFTFPTSYVIGPEGRLRYGVYGAVDWSDRHVVEKLAALMPDATTPAAPAQDANSDSASTPSQSRAVR